jgi:predicted nucleic acid-binding protein
VNTWVVDASVALKWFVPEQLSDLAEEFYNAGYRLVAPRLIATEMANALVRKTMQGAITHRDATIHLRLLKKLQLELIEFDDLVDAAFENACALRHPIYDLIYLETARRLDAQLVTADRRFTAKLAGTDFAGHVTILSDWQPA